MIKIDNLIKISELNDFIFCPISIYFHKLYGDYERNLYQEKRQIMGTKSHEAIDTNKYSSKKNVLQAIDIYCEEFGLIGKIDIFDIETGVLTERKNRITKIYDGYIFQLYAQYYALIEMGYSVKKLRFYSFSNNKNYDVKLPKENIEMDLRFRKVINDMRKFDVDSYLPDNILKCKNCIYYQLCDRGIE